METELERVVGESLVYVEDEGYEAGFRQGFMEGASVCMNNIMGWGEDRNPFAHGVWREELEKYLAKWGWDEIYKERRRSGLD